MSQINEMIESRLRTVRQDARMQPVIDQVKAAGRAAGPTSATLLDAAARAARDSFTREGVKPTAIQLRERAFLAAAAAATEAPVALGDLPAGTDKTQHFFVSGMISLKVAEVADTLLPRFVAEKLGVATSVALGWVKEVYDIWHSPQGYNREDLKADVAGAKRPFSLAVPQ